MLEILKARYAEIYSQTKNVNSNNTLLIELGIIKKYLNSIFGMDLRDIANIAKNIDVQLAYDDANFSGNGKIGAVDMTAVEILLYAKSRGLKKPKYNCPA
jgi:hypothetical protein